MNIDNKFVHIADIDVSSIKALINELTPAHWLLDDARQKKYEVHTDTETIPLVMDKDFRHINPTKRPALEKFGESIRPVLMRIADHYESSAELRSFYEKNGQGYFIRANLVKLKAGGSIKKHQDKTFSLRHSHRLHIPIITNDQVFFQIDDLTLNMLEGEIIEINNYLNHAVENKSEIDRVHLILDWVVPGEPCCCGGKAHPDIPCEEGLCKVNVRLHLACNCFNYDQ